LRTCLIWFLVFHNFPLINYGGDSSVLKIIFFIRRPRRDPGCDKGELEM